MLSSRLSHVSLTQSASFDSDSESLHGSPRYKMVSTCLNCSYTFRTGSSTCPDFCSKGKITSWVFPLLKIEFNHRMFFSFLL